MKLPDYLQRMEVTVKPKLSDGAHGPIYDNKYQINGYFQEERELVRDDEGDEVVSNSQLFTSEKIDLKKGSIITFEGNEHTVMRTSQKRNAMTGKFHHTQVWMR
jgi:hypothetical protein